MEKELSGVNDVGGVVRSEVEGKQMMRRKEEQRYTWTPQHINTSSARCVLST